MFYLLDVSKDVRLPVQLQRAMAAEAEAAREARAKVRRRGNPVSFTQHPTTWCPFLQIIAAEGEKNASRALKEASEVIAESSAALQLRYLQVRDMGPQHVAFVSRRNIPGERKPSEMCTQYDDRTRLWQGSIFNPHRFLTRQ